MRRFRFTIIAICLILTWLAYADITLYVRNLSPQEIAIGTLETEGPKREWIKVTGGYIDLAQAINMSGTIEIDSFLVPLKSAPESEPPKVWFETRDPALIKALKTYYFQLDSQQQREQFQAEHHDLFFGQRTVTGMLTGGLVADNNRDKLIQLLNDMNVPVQPGIIFISEAKQPVKWRGFIFAIIAMAGIMKLAHELKAGPTKTSKDP